MELSIVCWVPSKRRLFDVRSFYNVLVCNDGTPFPLKTIWRIEVLLRVTFFAWSATLKKILTMENVRKLHVIVVDWCCMCKRNGEFMDHLFIHCDVVCTLWNAIFNRVGLFGSCLDR